MGIVLQDTPVKADEINTTDFVTTWRITSPTDTSITIPTNGGGYNYNVDWDNDGVPEQTGLTSSATHNFGSQGDYTIRISGTFPRFYAGSSSANAKKLVDINQWGTNQWTTMNYAFSWTSLSSLSATDTPDLSQVTNTSGMFNGATTFNSDLSGWDMSKVTNLNAMFSGATSFNQDLSAWNLSSATNLSYMFNNASSFNGDISNWNTGNVTTMAGMFNGATSFNQSLPWDTSKVTTMSNMFYNATAFNGLIGSWNTSSVTDMSFMFNYARDFNQDISSWNTGNVTTMASMFYNARAFNRDLATWNTGNVTTMASMFNEAVAFNGDISAWNTGNVTTMSNMFYFARAFNKNLSGWNTSKVTTMTGMFGQAIVFNGDISAWNTSNVTQMNGMFSWATVFNQDISGWTTSKVTTMASMFSSASAFNQDISAWSVSSVTNFSGMFSSATSFNQDISSWAVSGATTMASMFSGATAFNQDISPWNVSNVTDMSYMFSWATVFNQDISTWNVANVTNMNSMFSTARAFDQNIAAWNVSNVTNMGYMFANTEAFNQDLSIWNVGNVTNMGSMFSYANGFNQNLSAWDIRKVTTMAYMFNGNTTALAGPLSTANYDATLIGWAAKTGLRTGVVVGASGLAYCSPEAKAARQSLITMYNWSFSGDAECSTLSSPGLPQAIPGAYSVALTWDAPYETRRSLTDYRVEYSIDSGATWQSFTHQPSKSTSITVGGLQANTNYSFRVAGVNGHGVGNFSNTTTARTLTATPDAPSGLEATPTETTITLSWQAPNRNGGLIISGYTVEISNDGGASWQVAPGGSVTTPGFSMTGLPPATDYRLRVAATNSQGTGVYSESVVTRTRSVAPDAPLQLLATPGKERVELAWQAPSSTGGEVITDYLVEYSLDDGTTWTEVSREPSTDTHHSVEQLYYPVQHRFRVSAITSIGKGIASDTVEATPVVTPSDAGVIGAAPIDESDEPTVIPKLPTFSGTTIPLSRVVVTVYSDPVSCEATSDSEGYWSCTLPTTLAAGSHQAIIDITLPDDTTLQLGPYAVTVHADPVPPPVETPRPIPQVQESQSASSPVTPGGSQEPGRAASPTQPGQHTDGTDSTPPAPPAVEVRDKPITDNQPALVATVEKADSQSPHITAVVAIALLLLTGGLWMIARKIRPSH